MARPAALVTACCSAMPDVVHPVRVGGRELRQPGRVQHRRGDRDHVRALGADRDQLVGRTPWSTAAAVPTARGALAAGRRGDLVQAVLVVLLGQRVAEALAGDHVHEHRAAEVARLAQRVLDRLLVVAVDRAEVLQAEVLEQHLRLQDVLEALLDAVQRLVQRRADQRRARDSVVLM